MNLVLLFLFVSNIFALEVPKTHLLVMGGSGDPAGKSTIFDDSFSALGNYYQQKLLQGKVGETSVSFNGGHANTDALKAKFYRSGHVNDFTEKTFNDEIDRYKKMIAGGQSIKRGEQLLIYIDSHGAEKGGDKIAHSISTGDKALKNYDSLRGTTLINLGPLEELKKLAKDKGVKLAIVDLSCHSGNSQEFADNNTCVITSTGNLHYGYTTFADNFSENMRPGADLESVFLKSRREDTAADFPEISTPEGKLIQDKLYFLLGPYLNFFGKTEKLTPQLKKEAEEKCYTCGRNMYFEGLTQLLDELEKTTTQTKKIIGFEYKQEIADFAELKKALLEYKNLQTEMVKEMRLMNEAKLQRVEVIDAANSFTRAQIMATDWEGNISSIQRRLKKTKLSAEENKKLQNNLSIYQKANMLKIRLAYENTDLSGYREIVKRFDAGEEKTRRLAKTIAAQEKKLFDGIYKKYSKENNKNNPCKDFKL